MPSARTAATTRAATTPATAHSAPAAPATTRATAAVPHRPAVLGRRRRTVVLVGALAGLAGLLAIQVAVQHQPGYLVSRPALLYLTGLWWVLGIITAALLTVARPRRLALGLLIAAIAAIHVIALTGGPRMSDDLYRYAWDGRVQAAGVDPYRYGPLDPALTDLRDDWLFPDSAHCTPDNPLPRCTRLNYPHAHTIYPPLAQAYFAAVHLLPGPPREHRLQLYASLTSFALVGLLMRMLITRGRDPRQVAFYALTPLAGLDVGSDAHVDVLGALLALAAIATLTATTARPGQPRRPRQPRQPRQPRRQATAKVARGRDETRASPSRRPLWLAGALLGASVAVKLYPVLLAPALVGRGRADALGGGRWRWRAEVLGAAGAVIGLAYLPHILAVGTDAVGFLPQYLNVEGYDQGGRFLLLAGLGLDGSVAKAVAVGTLAVVTVAVLRADPQRVPVERAALWMFGAAFLTATPAQPWYGVMLAALAVVAGRLEWLAVAAAAYPLYISLFTDVPGDAWTLRVSSYAVAAAIVFIAAVLRAVRRRPPLQKETRQAERGTTTVQPGLTAAHPG